MKKIRVALLGNPNVGKSSLFNSLTGKWEKVANWPGKTVECKIGICKIEDIEIELIDFPGIYNLTPISEEEEIAVETLNKEKFDVYLQIVDAVNLDKNLFLTLQLLEKSQNVIIALNMVEEAERRGIDIDVNKLEEMLDIKVVKIDARKRETLLPLVKAIVEVAQKEKKEEKKIFNEKFEVIDKIVKEVIKKIDRDRKFETEELIDKILLSPVGGVFIFLLVMYAIFYLTFEIGGYLHELGDVIWEKITFFIISTVEGFFGKGIIVDILKNGILLGFGSVLVFLPQLLLLSSFLYLLEEIGYLPRAIVALYRFLKPFGIEGKGLIALLLGFGCNVVAIMATRLASDWKSKVITILAIPFMPCSARFTVFALFSSVFFPGNEANIVFLLYIFGIIVGLISAFIFKAYLKKDSENFILEIPRLHLPNLKNIYMEVKEVLFHFLKRAGIIIVIISILNWFLINFYIGEDNKNFGEQIGKFIAAFFSPIGIGDEWQIGLALLNGFIAKEVIIASLATTYDVESEEMLKEKIKEKLSQESAVALMVFILFYLPCLATLIVTITETKSIKIGIFMMIYTLFVAYLLSIGVYNLLHAIKVF